MNLNDSELRISVNKWMCLLVCSILLTGLLLWVTLGTIPVYAHARGMIISAESAECIARDIEKSIMETQRRLMSSRVRLQQITSLYKNGIVNQQQYDATYTQFQQAQAKLEEAYNGGVQAEANNQSDCGTKISSSYVLIGVVYAPDASQIQHGMRVKLRIDNGGNQREDDAEGYVESVSQYPALKTSLNRYIGNIAVTDELFKYGIPYLINIHVDKNIQQKGSAVLQVGMMAMADIHVKDMIIYDVIKG